MILLHIFGWWLILGSMVRLIHFLLILVTTSVRSRLSLQAENAALRNQLFLYRKSGQRPRIRSADRLLWCFIAKIWVGWRSALYFVQPRTVTTWQKKRFRDYWRALSQPAKAGRPRISRELRKLIVRMCGKPIRRGVRRRSSLSSRCLESMLPSQR